VQSANLHKKHLKKNNYTSEGGGGLSFPQLGAGVVKIMAGPWCPTVPCLPTLSPPFNCFICFIFKIVRSTSLCAAFADLSYTQHSSLNPISHSPIASHHMPYPVLHSLTMVGLSIIIFPSFIQLWPGVGHN